MTEMTYNDAVNAAHAAADEIESAAGRAAFERTLTEILNRHRIEVPDDLIADLVVPVLPTPQRQGDVLIVPRGPLSAAEREACELVPPGGVPAVRGEATGNTHMLDADGPVLFARRESGVLLGVVEVPDGSVGWLIHTDEHGANGIAPGTYSLHGKREQADEVRRVAD